MKSQGEIESDKILKGIENFELTKKRMEIINLKNEIKIINDAYYELDKGIDAMKKGHIMRHDEAMQMIRERLKEYAE